MQIGNTFNHQLYLKQNELLGMYDGREQPPGMPVVPQGVQQPMDQAGFHEWYQIGYLAGYQEGFKEGQHAASQQGEQTASQQGQQQEQHEGHPHAAHQFGPR